MAKWAEVLSESPGSSHPSSAFSNSCPLTSKVDIIVKDGTFVAQWSSGQGNGIGCWLHSCSRFKACWNSDRGELVGGSNGPSDLKCGVA